MKGVSVYKSTINKNEFEIYICTGDIKNKKIKNAIIKKIQFQSIAEECSIKIG